MHQHKLMPATTSLYPGEVVPCPLTGCREEFRTDQSAELKAHLTTAHFSKDATAESACLECEVFRGESDEAFKSWSEWKAHCEEWHSHKTCYGNAGWTGKANRAFRALLDCEKKVRSQEEERAHAEAHPDHKLCSMETIKLVFRAPP